MGHRDERDEKDPKDPKGPKDGKERKGPKDRGAQSGQRGYRGFKVNKAYRGHLAVRRPSSTEIETRTGAPKVFEVLTYENEAQGAPGEVGLAGPAGAPGEPGECLTMGFLFTELQERRTIYSLGCHLIISGRY